MTVAIIGSGNVAAVLGRLALNSEHVVVHVASRNTSNAALLAKELNSEYSSYEGILKVDADIYLVAVADAAIAESVSSFASSDKLVVHTAGAVPMNILQHVTNRHGVLYPLQSLRKEMLPIDDVPFLIDGNTPDVREVIREFALTLSNNVTEADDVERLKHHAAAVIVNNFTNHLYALTEDFCSKENISFQTLLPLIRETTSRLSTFSPATLQTGPAFRKDKVTMDKHKIIFDKYPALKKLYESFSQSIMDPSCYL